MTTLPTGSLVKIGRARVLLALPRHREQLMSLQDPYLDYLFEVYPLASLKLDEMLGEHPSPADLVTEYREICVDLQELIALFLDQFGEH